MRLFSLTGLLAVIIFIFALYKLFNNETRYKIIIIVFLFLFGFYIFNKLNIFRKNTSLINSIKDATTTTIIPKERIFTKGTYSLSMWLYIDDWNYKFGEKKEIIKRTNSQGVTNPFIYLDPYENNIITEFYVKPPEDIVDKYNEALKFCKGDTIEGFEEKTTCSLNTTTGLYEKTNDDIICKEGSYYCLDDRKTEFACTDPKGMYSSTLINVPLQKWFHVSLVFGNKHLDTYMNGKLVTTKSFNGVQFLEEYINSDFVICGNGGFAGSISKFDYYNEVLSPQTIWDIYNEGFNHVMVGSLFNRYNASVTFYEDSNEKVKYYLT